MTPIRRRPTLELSLTGMVYGFLMMFMGLAAISTLVNLLFAVFGMMVGILIVAFVIGWMGLRKLSIKRSLPEHATVGEPVLLRYEISNQKRAWPSLSVTLAELEGVEAFAVQPQAYLLHAAAGDNAAAWAEPLAKRRGEHPLGKYQLSTSFPFGFIRRGIYGSVHDSLMVYPAVARVDPAIVRLCFSEQSAGTLTRSRRGGADEFYGVKDYRDGDNPRWIYWRRTARTGAMVTREMTHVSPPRLLLLVDTHRTLNTLGAQADIERVIAMAASMAEQAMDQGMPAGLVAWSGRWVHIPPSRGKRHRRDLMATLACLPANADHDPRELVEQGWAHLGSATTAVLLTPASALAEVPQIASVGIVVLAADSPEVRNGFKFHKTVDFTRCMPVEEERMKAEGRET